MRIRTAVVASSRVGSGAFIGSAGRGVSWHIPFVAVYQRERDSPRAPRSLGSAAQTTGLAGASAEASVSRGLPSVSSSSRPPEGHDGHESANVVPADSIVSAFGFLQVAESRCSRDDLQMRRLADRPVRAPGLDRGPSPSTRRHRPPPLTAIPAHTGRAGLKIGGSPSILRLTLARSGARLALSRNHFGTAYQDGSLSWRGCAWNRQQ